MELRQFAERDVHSCSFIVSQDGIEIAQDVVDMCDKVDPNRHYDSTHTIRGLGKALLCLGEAYDILRSMEAPTERQLDFLEAGMADLATMMMDSDPQDVEEELDDMDDLLLAKLQALSEDLDVDTDEPCEDEDEGDEGDDSVGAGSSDDEDPELIQRIKDAMQQHCDTVVILRTAEPNHMGRYLGTVYVGGFGPTAEEEQSAGDPNAI